MISKRIILARIIKGKITKGRMDLKKVMMLPITEPIDHLSLVLWGIQGALSVPLFFQDIRYKRVSSIFVVLFSIGLLMVAVKCEGIYGVAYKTALVLGIMAGVWWCWHLKMGNADFILLGAIFIFFPVSLLPGYLIICGTLGVMTALFWRYRYGHDQYPFIPAILLSFWMQLYLEGRW